MLTQKEDALAANNKMNFAEKDHIQQAVAEKLIERNRRFINRLMYKNQLLYSNRCAYLFNCLNLLPTLSRTFFSRSFSIRHFLNAKQEYVVTT